MNRTNQLCRILRSFYTVVMKADNSKHCRVSSLDPNKEKPKTQAAETELKAWRKVSLHTVGRCLQVRVLPLFDLPAINSRYEHLLVPRIIQVPVCNLDNQQRNFRSQVMLVCLLSKFQTGKVVGNQTEDFISPYTSAAPLVRGCFNFWRMNCM